MVIISLYVTESKGILKIMKTIIFTKYNKEISARFQKSKLKVLI